MKIYIKSVLEFANSPLPRLEGEGRVRVKTVTDSTPSSWPSPPPPNIVGRIRPSAEMGEKGSGGKSAELKSVVERKSLAMLTAVLLTLAVFNSAYAGTVQGTVKFTGAAPEPQAISMNADPVCAGLHAEPVYEESVIANPNGTLANVFVYVKEGLGGQTFPAVPAESVRIDQAGCRYAPHVFGIRTGQTLEIMNSDNTLHNVHSLAQHSKQFNLGMPIQGMKLKKKFEKPEVMVKFKCDVHPWMSAFIGVLDHPFFSVTSVDGSFEIKNVPAGNYVLETWHEKYGTQTQSVTVTDEAPVSAEFTFA